MSVNPYLPVRAVIDDIKPEAEETKTFTIGLGGDSPNEGFKFSPGQFVQVTALGVGEAPISICSSPLNEGKIQLTVRKMGRVTTALHEARVGDIVGIRGPYGNGWPLKKTRGKNMLIIAGGIGLAPLRALINTAIASRKEFARVVLCYGARKPEALLYRCEYAHWERSGVDVLLTVDVPAEGWEHNVGVVTTLLDKINPTPEDTVANICGPPIMIKFTMRKLKELHYPSKNIYASLESMMRCGIGKCGHCHFGDKHVCVDGPVFSYDEMVGLPRDFVQL